MNQVRWDRGLDGRLKAWVSTDATRVRLRKCADIVTETFGGEARDRVGGLDLSFWDFMIGSVLITLHMEQHVGVAVLANDQSAPSEALVKQIAEYLVAHPPA